MDTPAIVGVSLALAVAALARIAGFDRDRAFYPVVLIVVGSYYILFAVMGGSEGETETELVIFVLFAAVAVLGFRTSLWLVAAGLAMHGVLDFFHHSLLPGRGVPVWWPPFCLAFDVAAAGCLALLLVMKPELSTKNQRTECRLADG